MPNEQSLVVTAQLVLAQAIDDTRSAGDPSRLPADLRTKVDADVLTLQRADANTALSGSDRAGSSAAARDALAHLEELLIRAHDFISGLDALPESRRLEVFTSYGWAGGDIGLFNDARIIGLARLGTRPHFGVDPSSRYPEELVGELKSQLAIFDANSAAIIGPDRLHATHIRNLHLAAAEATLERVKTHQATVPGSEPGYSPDPPCPPHAEA